MWPLPRAGSGMLGLSTALWEQEKLHLAQREGRGSAGERARLAVPETRALRRFCSLNCSVTLSKSLSLSGTVSSPARRRSWTRSEVSQLPFGAWGSEDHPWKKGVGSWSPHSQPLPPGFLPSHLFGVSAFRVSWHSREGLRGGSSCEIL